MNLPLDPRLPLGGIALILLLVWMLGGRRQPTPLAPDEAASLLAAPELGFMPADLLLAEQGSGALARDAGGRLALIFPHGNRWLVRVFSRGDVHVVAKGDEVTVATGRFPRQRWRLPVRAIPVWLGDISEER